MLLFSALFACQPVEPDEPVETGEPDDTSVSPETGTAASGCADIDAPALSTDVWSLAGGLPATGVLSLATTGSGPIYAGSHSTGVWVTEDAESWASVMVDVTHTLAELIVRPGDPQHVFRSSGGALQRTRDGGQTWEALALGLVAPGLAPQPVWAIAVTPWSPDRVLAADRSGASYLSLDNGDTFVSTAPILIRHEAPSDDPFQTNAWRLLPESTEGGRVLFTDGYGVATSDDTMTTWVRRLDTPVGGYSLTRDPFDPAHLFVGGPEGLYESADEGTTWSLRDLGGDVVLGAWSSDGARLVLIGSDTVFVSADAGASFTTKPHAYAVLGAVAVLDDGRILLAHHDGVVVTRDDGATWAPAGEGMVDRGMAVVVADPRCPARVYAASRCGGGLYRSEDYGQTWAHVHQYVHYVMGLHFDPSVADRLWAVTDDRLMRSEDAGANWTEVLQRYHFHGFALHPDEPDTLLLGSVADGEWADTAMHVLRSDDGGSTWADSSAGLPDTAPESDASAHTLVRWPGAPEVVLLGTYKGGGVSHQTGAGAGLWRSIDGGGSWTQAALDVDDVAFLVAAGDRVWAATGSGLWGSGDLGVSWAQAEGPEGGILSVAFQGSVGLAFGQDGRLWASEDTGATWVERDASLPRNPSSNLAQVSLSVDGAVGYVTVFDHGVWRIGL